MVNIFNIGVKNIRILIGSSITSKNTDIGIVLALAVLLILSANTVTVGSSPEEQINQDIDLNNQYPSVSIVEPERGYFYFKDDKLLRIPKLLEFFDCDGFIIGNITIEVEVNETDDFKVDRIELYVEDELKAQGTENPFNWTLDETLFGIYPIKAVAYDENDTVSDEMYVFILSLGRSVSR